MSICLILKPLSSIQDPIRWVPPAPAAASVVRGGGASDGAVGDARPHRGSETGMGPTAATSLAVSLSLLTSLTALDLRCLCVKRRLVCACVRACARARADAAVWQRRPASREAGSRRRRVKHKPYRPG